MASKKTFQNLLYVLFPADIINIIFSYFGNPQVILVPYGARHRWCVYQTFPPTLLELESSGRISSQRWKGENLLAQDTIFQEELKLNFALYFITPYKSGFLFFYIASHPTDILLVYFVDSTQPVNKISCLLPKTQLDCRCDEVIPFYSNSQLLLVSRRSNKVILWKVETQEISYFEVPKESYGTSEYRFRKGSNNQYLYVMEAFSGHDDGRLFFFLSRVDMVTKHTSNFRFLMIKELPFGLDFIALTENQKDYLIFLDLKNCTSACLLVDFNGSVLRAQEPWLYHLDFQFPIPMPSLKSYFHEKYAYKNPRISRHGANHWFIAESSRFRYGAPSWAAWPLEPNLQLDFHQKQEQKQNPPISVVDLHWKSHVVFHSWNSINPPMPVTVPEDFWEKTRSCGREDDPSALFVNRLWLFLHSILFFLVVFACMVFFS